MDDYDDAAIGKRLQLARERAGFASATEAAAALGMKYPTYAGHENGSRGVVRGALTYSRRFKVSLDWLLTGRGLGPGEASETPEAALRAALLAYGVDRSDLGRAISAVKVFVDDHDERSSQDLREDRHASASLRHAREPLE